MLIGLTTRTGRPCQVTWWSRVAVTPRHRPWGCEQRKYACCAVKESLVGRARAGCRRLVQKNLTKKCQTWSAWLLIPLKRPSRAAIAERENQ